ncbi:uncharacterized protein PV07_11990 [Cladophialophora immunda]|uniref:Uncharacterized protein n=1 Tax=Cladophialophora immunda TaxID=569365 RepID=A0A0D2BZT0_9EURO|nr:uncharacterized protein PV07_11990 [Cladophialophora immunda]KIW23820.1 hypothetical protein PV07_11990 [Cladophialophora immunda]
MHNVVSDFRIAQRTAQRLPCLALRRRASFRKEPHPQYARRHLTSLSPLQSWAIMVSSTIATTVTYRLHDASSLWCQHIPCLSPTPQPVRGLLVLVVHSQRNRVGAGKRLAIAVVGLGQGDAFALCNLSPRLRQSIRNVQTYRE